MIGHGALYLMMWCVVMGHGALYLMMWGGGDLSWCTIFDNVLGGVIVNVYMQTVLVHLDYLVCEIKPMV